MNHALSQRMLRRISSFISEGRPLWGLLIANEYLDPSSGLRQAFVRKTRGACPAGLPLALEERILRGERLAQFCDEERSIIIAGNRLNLKPRALLGLLRAAQRRKPHRLRKQYLRHLSARTPRSHLIHRQGERPAHRGS